MIMKTEEKPLLSICVPTYKRVDLLLRTLRSVRSSCDEVEIIVTDNTEDDSTRHAVEGFFKDYSGRWRYHANGFPDDLPGFAMMVGNHNQGVELARGRYIYIIHDDDYVLPGSVERMVELLKGEAGSHEVIVFGVQLVDLAEHVAKTHHFASAGHHSPEDSLDRLLRNSASIRFPQVILSRKAYEDEGDWSLEAQTPMDYDMWTRMFGRYGVYVVPEVLAAYTIHPGSVTMKMFNIDSIKLLLRIFDNVEARGQVPADRLAALKSLFLHQFILAGTWKFIRTSSYDEARSVLSLFKADELKDLRPAYKWLPLRFAFSAFLKIR